MTSIKMGFCLIPTSKLCNLLSKLLINLRVQSRLRLLEENSDGKTYFSPHNHSVLTPADSRESGSAGTKSQKKTNKKMWRGVVVVGGGDGCGSCSAPFRDLGTARMQEDQTCRREMCHKRGFSDAGFFPPYPHRLSSITSAESVWWGGVLTFTRPTLWNRRLMDYSSLGWMTWINS